MMRARAHGFVSTSAYAVLSRAGFMARAVLYGIIGLSAFYNGAYGSWLLGTVALGLIIFSVFSLIEARYRRI